MHHPSSPSAFKLYSTHYQRVITFLTQISQVGASLAFNSASMRLLVCQLPDWTGMTAEKISGEIGLSDCSSAGISSLSERFNFSQSLQSRFGFNFHRSLQRPYFIRKLIISLKSWMSVCGSPFSQIPNPYSCRVLQSGQMDSIQKVAAKEAEWGYSTPGESVVLCSRVESAVGNPGQRQLLIDTREGGAQSPSTAAPLPECVDGPKLFLCQSLKLLMIHIQNGLQLTLRFRLNSRPMNEFKGGVCRSRLDLTNGQSITLLGTNPSA